jgi:N-acetylmuramoyl-L-alanine amidase
VIETPSPNFDARPAPVSLIILHYTGMQTAQAAIARLCDPAAKVSAHYTVLEDGIVHRHVAEENRAWHAGVSFWHGERNINGISIGIEIVNPGHEFGYRPFPPIQMQAVRDLCQDIMRRHTIAARNVLGHSDVAITRKIDPGELFDWRYLAAHGIGIMPPENTTAPPDMQRAQKLLADFGYDTADLAQTITAFQRHFCPGELNQGLTPLTMGTLVAIST